MEEAEIGDTPKEDFKEVEIVEGNNKYICQIKMNKECLDISLYENNELKYKGKIHITKILLELDMDNFTIQDIYDEICKLENRKFRIKKDENKYTLQIEFLVISQKRYLKINLKDAKDEIEFEKTIKELNEKKKEKDDKIKKLEEEINNYKNY